MTSKRVFDLILTIPGLVLLSPFFLVISIMIKKDSKGPIFFKQNRVGQWGTLFKIYKFRTMVVDAEKKGLAITTRDDCRITKLGKFLRKTKLDELPQLINVIRGEMSLVGPRPEVPKYVDLYPEDLKPVILSVLPGITDNASIEFKDEASQMSSSRNPEDTYVKEILPIKLKYYNDYVQSHTIWGDFCIILNTIKNIT